MTDLNQLTSESLGAEYILFDPDDSQPTYIGLNTSAQASQTLNQDWVIYKLSYSGANTTQIQKKRGAWADRASLF